jgi:hypothetical protein
MSGSGEGFCGARSGAAGRGERGEGGRGASRERGAWGGSGFGHTGVRPYLCEEGEMIWWKGMG